MRRALTLALIAAFAAAHPVAAKDRVLTSGKASLLTEDLVGQPLWSLLAGCAGSYGAAHAYYAARGKAADAEASKAMGGEMLELAISRIVIDRRLDRQQALQVTLAAVEAGRGSGETALASGGHEGLRWLAVSTACDEIAAA